MRRSSSLQWIQPALFPHILVIINHDETARYTDLVVTFSGFERADNGSQFPVQPGAAEGVPPDCSRVDQWPDVPAINATMVRKIAVIGISCVCRNHALATVSRSTRINQELGS
jgi:hypothetical protein